MVKSIDPNGVYDVDALAELLGVHRMTVLRRIKKDELPKGKKVGKKRYFIGQEILNSLTSPSIRVNLVTKEELEKKKK